MSEQTETAASACQILVVNIAWNPKNVRAKKRNANEELPTQFVFDLPENVLAQARKKKNNFEDVVESFTYNYLTKKLDHEVLHCQIYLPLEDSVQTI